MSAMRVEVKWTFIPSSTGMFMRTSLWLRAGGAQSEDSTPYIVCVCVCIYVCVCLCDVYVVMYNIKYI